MWVYFKKRLFYEGVDVGYLFFLHFPNGVDWKRYVPVLFFVSCLTLLLLVEVNGWFMIIFMINYVACDHDHDHVCNCC